MVGVNTAVSWCDPTANVDVVDAVPLLTAVGSPILVDPSLNCTMPVAAAGVTVAVSVRGLPWASGEAADVLRTLLVAAAPEITNGTAGEVDGL